MPTYIEIKTQAEIDDFLETCKGFHDSVIKEMHLLNSAHVNHDFSMSLYFKINLRLLVQTQWSEVPAVEILMGDLRAMSIENDADALWGATGAVTKSNLTEETEISLRLDQNLFRCGRLLYRLAPEYLGPDSRFGEEIILDETEDIEWLDEEWVICRRCSESWRPGDRKILVCPKCSQRNNPGRISPPYE